MTQTYPSPDTLMTLLAEGFRGPLSVSPDVTVQLHERQCSGRYPDMDIATVMTLSTPVPFTLGGQQICHPLVSEYAEGEEEQLIENAQQLQQDIDAFRAAQRQGREYLPAAVQRDMRRYNTEQLSSETIAALLTQADLSPRWRQMAVQVLWDRIKDTITAGQPYPSSEIHSFPLPSDQPQPPLFQVVAEEQRRYQWRVNDPSRQLDSGGFRPSDLAGVKAAYVNWVNPTPPTGASG